MAGATRCPMTWCGTCRPSTAPRSRGSQSGTRHVHPVQYPSGVPVHHHSLRFQEGVAWSDGKGAIEIERWPDCRELTHPSSPLSRYSQVRAVPAGGN